MLAANLVANLEGGRHSDFGNPAKVCESQAIRGARCAMESVAAMIGCQVWLPVWRGEFLP